MKLKKNVLALLIYSAALIGASHLQAQTTPAAQPTICNRACWVARSGTCTSTMAGLNRAIIHNTGAAPHNNTTGLEDSKAWMRSIQNHQMDNNGWCDTGYHFVVDKFGNIFEARKNSIAGLPRGAHDTCNGDSFGFCLMGDYDTQIPSAAGLAGMHAVMSWRMPSGWSPYGGSTYCGKSVGYVDGHLKVTSTTCPGANYYNPYIGSNFSTGTTRNDIAARRTPSGGVVVDNNSTGFAASASWITASSSTDKYGADYRYRSTQPLSDNAVWTGSLPSTKTYAVSAWWPQGANRSATAAYHVVHAAGTTVVTVNQQANGGKWNALGSWSMNAGANQVKLSCWTTTGFIVVADAVRWQ